MRTVVKALPLEEYVGIGALEANYLGNLGCFAKSTKRNTHTVGTISIF